MLGRRPPRQAHQRTILMSADESRALFAQDLERARQNRNETLHENVQRTHDRNRVRSSPTDPTSPLALLHARTTQKALPAPEHAATLLLTNRASGSDGIGGGGGAGMGAGALQTMAQSAGLVHRSLTQLQQRADQTMVQAMNRRGREYDNAQSGRLNLAQMDTLVRLYQNMCLRDLAYPGVRQYDRPQPGGVCADDPDHDCMHPERNLLPCNMIEVPAGSSKSSGRLHYCTVTGYAHFCSRSTCEYFVRQKNQSYDVCELTGACFTPLPSSGLSYLGVTPEMRRGRSEVDDNEVDMITHKTSRRRRMEDNLRIREGVAELRNREAERAITNQVSAEHKLQGVLTPQAAEEVERRMEQVRQTTRAESVRCAVHANVGDRTLMRKRLLLYRQAAVSMFTTYHQCEARPEDLDAIVNVCEKTWLLVVTSPAFIQSSMSYPVHNHPFVIMDIASEPTGYRVSLPCPDDPRTHERVLIVPPCETLVRDGHFTGRIKNTKNKFFNLCTMRNRFRSYINELAELPEQRPVLRQLHQEYVQSGVCGTV